MKELSINRVLEQVDSGWIKIIQDFFLNKTDHAIVTGVKRAFGGLQLSIEGGTDNDRYLVKQVDRKTFSTCEICGAKGEAYTMESQIVVRCRRHMTWLYDRDKLIA